jgi:TetR/AcrR family transcriptional repressor of nem operon
MEIIEVASYLIHSRGYEATSVQDIMQAAQIGKGQFYYYFPKKQDLGLAVIDYCFTKWEKRVIKENLATDDAPEEKINRMLSCAIAIHQNRVSKCGCFFGNLAIELSEHNEVFREKIYQMFTTWTHYLTVLINEWRRNRELPINCESELLAESIVALLEGSILLMKSRQDITPLLHAALMVKKILGIENGGEFS